MKIEIQNMTNAHISGVVNVENNSFSLPWSEKSFVDELNNPISKYFVAIIDDTVAGYIGMWEISGQCDITNIAVLPRFRRKKIGYGLLSHTISYCTNNNLSPITLEVRKSNIPAQELYKSFGFKVIGNRKKYYADTGEDALILSLDL